MDDGTLTPTMVTTGGECWVGYYVVGNTLLKFNFGICKGEHQLRQVPALILHDHNNLRSNSPHLSLCSKDKYKATFTPYNLCAVLKSDLPDSPTIGY